jgi:fructose 1,6-bisphosphatase
MGYLLFTLVLIGVPTFFIARRVYQKQGSNKTAAVISTIVFILIYFIMCGVAMALFGLAGAFGR